MQQPAEKKKAPKRKPEEATVTSFKSRAKTALNGYLGLSSYYDGAHPGDIHTERDITAERTHVDHWRLSMYMTEDWPCVQTKPLGTGRTEKFTPYFPWKGGVPTWTPFPAFERRTLDVLFQLVLHRELMRLQHQNPRFHDYYSPAVEEAKYHLDNPLALDRYIDTSIIQRRDVATWGPLSPLSADVLKQSVTADSGDIVLKGKYNMNHPNIIAWRLCSLSSKGVEEEVTWPEEIRFLLDLEQLLHRAPAWDEHARTELVTTRKITTIVSWRHREEWTVYQSKPKAAKSEPVPLQFSFMPHTAQEPMRSYEAHFKIRVSVSDVSYQQRYADD